MCDFINKFKHFEQRQINKLTEMIGKMTEITNPNPNVEKNECNESLAPRVAIWFHGPSLLTTHVSCQLRACSIYNIHQVKTKTLIS